MNIQQQQAALAALPTDQTAIPILQRIAQGQHPMFPPGSEWMGLAKMNEVKRSMEASQAMQQAAMAGQQAPTVRDQVQQGVAALAQQQMQTQQGQMAMAAQQAPQRMAAGGIARYAEGGGVSARMQDLLDARERYMRANADTTGIDQAIAYLRRQEQDAKPNQSAAEDARLAEKNAEIAASPPQPVWTGKRLSPEYVNAVLQSGSPEAKQAVELYLQQFPDGAKMAQRSEPRVAPAQGGVASVAPREEAPAGGIAALPAAGPPPAPQSVGDFPTYTPEMPEDPTAARKALMAGEPALQGDPMADRKAYAEKMAQREAAVRARQAEADPQMQREAWTRKLLAAANATGDRRGLQGIAAALGGFAEQGTRESQYRREMGEKRIGDQEKLEDLRISFEMETKAAERAAAEGRIAEALKHRENVAKIKEEARKLAYAGQVDKYKMDRTTADKRMDNESAERRQAMAGNTSLAVARERGAAGGYGGADPDKQQLAELRALQTSLKDQIKETFNMQERKQLSQQLAQVNAAISRMAGIESGGASKPGVTDLSGWGQPKLVQ